MVKNLRRVTATVVLAGALTSGVATAASAEPMQVPPGHNPLCNAFDWIPIFGDLVDSFIGCPPGHGMK